MPDIDSAQSITIVDPELIATNGLDFNLVLQGELQLPELQQLSLSVEDGLSADTIYGIVELGWPQLLELSLAHSPHFGDTFISDMKPLIQGTNFPKLKVLRLSDSPHGDELCNALAKSKLLPKLEVLEVSEAEVSEDGAQALLARRKACKNLRSLNLQRNYIDASLHEELSTLCAEVVLQPGADD